MSKLAHSPFVLMILDGWGITDNSVGNAIKAARTPNFDALWQLYPHQAQR